MRQEDNWLGSIAALLALALIVPRQFEYFTPDRLFACVLAVVVIWLASTRLDCTAWRILFAAGFLLNAGFLLWRLQWSASINAILSEYASVAPFIPDDTGLISVRTSASYLQLYCRAVRPRQLPCGFKPTLHFMGEIVGARPIALLTNYQLQPDAGFFPIGLRARWSEYLRLNRPFEAWPPPPEHASDLAYATALIERRPTNVIITSTGAPTGLFPAAAESLLADYRKVFTSSPLGAATVYVRNATVPGASR